MESGLLTEKEVVEDDFLRDLPKMSFDEFKTIPEEILRIIDLTDFYQKLKSI